jgi:NAD(P)H-nitrite reductase large subunit
LLVRPTLQRPRARLDAKLATAHCGTATSPLIVCICRTVSDRTLRSAISAGASTVDDLAASCRAGTAQAEDRLEAR